TCARFPAARRCVSLTSARGLYAASACVALGHARLGFALILGHRLVGANRRLVAYRRLDETARREALLDLVKRLLAEVAHAEELVVGGLQGLADLGAAVPVQRVEGPL